MALNSITVTIDTARITDCDSFHDVFGAAFGFPEFYGRNMNAWIDCMTSLDAPADGLTSVHAPVDGVLVLQLDGMRELETRCADIALEIHECAAFVNWRRMKVASRRCCACRMISRDGDRSPLPFP